MTVETMREEMDAIEARVRAAGYSMVGFLRVAGVDNSTWYKWRRGARMPMLPTWRVIERTLERIEGERQNGSAAGMRALDAKKRQRLRAKSGAIRARVKRNRSNRPV
jgi:hypothetical protein